ncbi:MAG: hypothetical protein JO006_12410 [Paucibacter sp.]|nr:hypothetical protein [Roseateles sp.]
MKQIAAPLILSVSLLAGLAQADGINAGIELQEKVSLADIGLPGYPGAVQVHEGKDGKEDKGAFSLNLWGGSFGMKLSILKYRSADSIEQVGQFYREAMGRYGKVLDCSMTAPSDDDKSEKKSIALHCSKDDVKAGKLVIKVGKDDKHFRMVALERQAKGVEFQLLNLAISSE